MILVAVTAVRVDMARTAITTQAPKAGRAVKDQQVEEKSCDEDRAGDHQHFGHGRIRPLVAAAAISASVTTVAAYAQRLGKGPVQEDISVETVSGAKHHQDRQDDENDHSNRIEHAYPQPDEKSDA